MNPNKLFSFYLISVTGGSASGKSLFISALKDSFSEKITIISQDDYYKSIEYQHKDEKGIYNFDLPEAIDHDLFLEHLTLLSTGKVIRKLEYTFNHPEKIPREKVFYPRPVIIIEGLFVEYHPVISQNIDFKVFIDADEEICFQRRRRRDIFERGIPEEIFLHQWNFHVLPAYRKFVLKFKESADLVVLNNQDFDEGLEYLKALISSKI